MYPSPPPPLTPPKHQAQLVGHPIDMVGLDPRRTISVPMDQSPAWMHSMAPDRPPIPVIPGTVPRNNTVPPVQTAAVHQPPQPTFATDTPPPKSTRVVIPSKRAAQNRAAQRAFRQRRDKYVKDLEQKVKEMESWPEEMERLREENKRLRETVAALEQRLAEVSGPGSGPRPPSNNAETVTPRQAPIINEQPPASSSSSLSSPPHPLSPPPQSSVSAYQSSQNTNPLLPVPLRQPNFAPPINSHAPSTSPVVMEHRQTTMESDTGLVQPDALPPDFWTFNNADLEFAFDSFFKDDFTSSPIAGNGDDDNALYTVNNSGQVLDDLVAMLQTRQRPQLPLETNLNQPSVPQQDSSSSSSFILHQQMPMQHQ